MLPGPCFGLLAGLRKESLKAGLGGGVFFGVLLPLITFVAVEIFLHFQRPSAFNRLSFRDRRLVTEALRTGTDIGRADLAPAVIEQARLGSAQLSKYAQRRGIRRWSLPAVVAVIVANDLVRHHPGPLTADAILAVVWLIGRPRWKGLLERRLGLNERAAAAARTHLDPETLATLDAATSKEPAEQPSPASVEPPPSFEPPPRNLSNELTQSLRAALDAAGITTQVPVVRLSDERATVILLTPEQLATLGKTRPLERSLSKLLNERVVIYPTAPAWLERGPSVQL